MGIAQKPSNSWALYTIVRTLQHLRLYRGIAFLSFKDTKSHLENLLRRRVKSISLLQIPNYCYQLHRTQSGVIFSVPTSVPRIRLNSHDVSAFRNSTHRLPYCCVNHMLDFRGPFAQCHTRSGVKVFLPALPSPPTSSPFFPLISLMLWGYF
jgi:hypothetical protein